MVIAICPRECFPIIESYSCRCGPVLALLLATSSAEAISLQVRFDQLSGSGWQAQQVEAQLQVATDRPAARLSIGDLRTADGTLVVEQLVLHCPRLTIASSDWHCPELGIDAVALDHAPLSGRGKLEYRPSESAWRLALPELLWGEAELDLSAEWARQQWSLMLSVDQLGPRMLNHWLALDESAGQLGGELRLRGTGASLEQAELSANSRALRFSAAGGQYAAERLGLDLNGRWQVDGTITAELRLLQGELYLAPMYWQQSPDDAPVQLSASGRWRNQALTVERLHWQHPGVLRAQASLAVNTRATPWLQGVSIESFEAELPGFQQTYLQPWLGDGVVADLDSRGSLTGRLRLTPAGIEALELRLVEVSLEDRRDRFSLTGLRGDVVLNPGPEPRYSGLYWRGGQLYRMPIGAAELAFESHDGELRLRQTTRIPVLDGALLLQQLHLGDLRNAVQLRFGGRLQAVSMEALSAALGWPPLAGTLAGVIPQVRYRDRRIDVDGALLVRVFDGDVTIANLALDEVLGDTPQLQADIELFQLDLRTLTETFDIGRIEGKLSGQVRDLHLVDWQPVRFDAFLHTPEGDRSRRRISQRAVEMISDLGGTGAAGAVSRVFLSLFEDFGYRRLGVGCRLSAGVCEMRGIGPEPGGQGYYLIEGSGLPRLDVIGYNRQVDWHELLARLQAAARSEGPIVE